MKFTKKEKKKDFWGFSFLFFFLFFSFPFLSFPFLFLLGGREGKGKKLGKTGKDSFQGCFSMFRKEIGFGRKVNPPNKDHLEIKRQPLGNFVKAGCLLFFFMLQVRLQTEVIVRIQDDRGKEII